MQLKRTIDKVIGEVSKGFPVVLLTGMRQVGKSWIMDHLKKNDRNYVCLDDLKMRALAKSDPKRFIDENPPPVIYDEIQYAPELFTYIKIYVDKHKKDGLFWLTGSQKFRLMEGVKESLAGRVAILRVFGFSHKEIIRKSKNSTPFLPLVKKSLIKPLTSIEVFENIWNGSFPKIITNKNTKNVRKIFYDSFIQTYIQRDVKDFYNIKNELSFYNFLVSVAARTGQLINYADLACDAHIDQRTAKLWLEILERSDVIQLVYPYSSNIIKRIVKTPKVYFLDTGLASYLCSWDSPDSLRNGAQSGAMFETYVFGEIIKSYFHNGDNPNIYFYRDMDQVEIDFIIEKNKVLYPIEVKRTANPGQSDYNSFRKLKNFEKGAVICLYERSISLDKKVVSIPIWEI